MNRKQRINNLLIGKLRNCTFQIIDNSHLHSGHNNFDGLKETHILLVLTYHSEEKIDRLKIHRQINNILKIEFERGLHSLEIKIN